MIEKARMSAAEFLRLPETTAITELIQGNLFLSPTPVPKHQRAVLRSANVIEDRMPNGEVFITPMSLYLDDENMPEPDLMWLSEGGRCKVGERYLEGPPDLIVEVLSPSTAKRDLSDKFELYQRFQVYEYWVIDPEAQYVSVWRLLEGKFARQGVYGPEDTFISHVLGDKTVAVVEIFS